MSALTHTNWSLNGSGSLSFEPVPGNGSGRDGPVPGFCRVWVWLARVRVRMGRARVWWPGSFPGCPDPRSVVPYPVPAWAGGGPGPVQALTPTVSA